MNLRRLTFKITLVLALILGPIVWLVTSTSGLNTMLTITSIFSPISFKYGQASGKILGQPIVLHDLRVEYAGNSLKIGTLIFDWQQRTLMARNVHGIEKFLPYAEALKYQAVILDKLSAQASIKDHKHVINIQANGHSLNTSLHSNMRLIHSGDTWDIQHALLNIGKNNLHLQHDRDDSYRWGLSIIDPQTIFTTSSGDLTAHGSVQDLYSAPKIRAVVKSKNFGLNNYQISKLQGTINFALQPEQPLHADIYAANLAIDQQCVKNIHIKVSGNLAQLDMHGSALYNQNILDITANSNIENAIWNIYKLVIRNNQNQLNGSALYNFKDNKGEANLRGKLFTVATTANIALQQDSLDLKLSMHSNQQNFLNGKLNIQRGNLSGKLKITADDLAFLMQWMPDVTRLKGKFSAQMQIAGTLQNPDITSDAHLTEVTATIPKLGIKIKPLELHMTGDRYGKFSFIGFGKMRRGPGDFTLTGYIEPFKASMPNSFSLVGNNVEFVNNELAHLLASHALNIHYAAEHKRLDITGDIEIQQGSVTIPDKHSQTIKSKDVVFVNEPESREPKHLIVINPDINLRILEGVKFAGFGLDAIISGKLNVSHRHDAMYADGRITIKEGTFQLPGQKLVINHGRLLYPPGTLLVNPVLDIKMLGKNSGQAEQSAPADLELTVQGTAQKPIISESGLATNKDRAMSQALLTGSSVISNNLLQEKLKISEIGLTSRDSSLVEFFDDPSKDKSSLKNKDLVLGRSLGKRFYIQYLHSIGEANKRVRLKYSLNHIWAIGLESGTQGGGADLSFAIERD